MSTLTLSARSVPLDDSWDVIVVGGGPAGCTAATAAAREGAKTLLIEASGSLGGMGAGGLIPAWCPFTDGKRPIYRGLAELVFTRCKAGMPHIHPDAQDWVAINPEWLKRIYDDLVTGAGANVLFQSMLSGVEMEENGVVSALLVSNKAGLTAYRAQVYVDATGDADLSAWAGAEFQQGAEDTGEVQPASHCFMLTNIDEYAFQHIDRHHWQQQVRALVSSERFPVSSDAHCCTSLIGPRTLGFNAGHLWGVDNTDPWSTSRALIDGRKIAAAFRDGLAEYAPATFANAFLAATGALMGIRESRRILGDYYLTLSDYLARRSFPDEICRNAYPIDIHTAKAEISDALDGKVHAMLRYENYRPGESHGIPYRCLTPHGLRNVLVAGRAISCDHPVQASVRVMPVCLAMGEAAGLAAAMAAGNNADVHAIDTQRLRARLIEEGGYLPPVEAEQA